MILILDVRGVVDLLFLVKWEEEEGGEVSTGGPRGRGGGSGRHWGPGVGVTKGRGACAWRKKGLSHCCDSVLVLECLPTWDWRGVVEVANQNVSTAATHAHRVARRRRRRSAQGLADTQEEKNNK